MRLPSASARLLGIESEEVWQPGKSRIRVEARSLLCYWGGAGVGGRA